MNWRRKYEDVLSTGQYYELLRRGFKVEPEPLIDGLEFYIDAFRELSTARPSGLSLSPIPFTAIVEYSRIYTVGDFEEFRHIIRMMDDTVLLWEVKKSGDSKHGGNVSNKAHPNKNRHPGRPRP